MGVTADGRPMGLRIGVVLWPSMDAAWGELLARTDDFAVIVVARELPKVREEDLFAPVSREPRIYSLDTSREVFPVPGASMIWALDAASVFGFPAGDNPIHRYYCEAQEQIASNVARERKTKRPVPGGFGFDVLVGGVPNTPSSRG